MVEKKVLKSEVDRKREIAEDVVSRFCAKCGDMRPFDEICEEALQSLHLTPEEAERRIEIILDEDDEYLPMEGDDGKLYFVGKAERIAEIRARVKV